GSLVALDPVCDALSVEVGGGLLPPFCHLFCTLGFTVESGEFFGDAADRAVLDDAPHCFGGLDGGVGEATVCPVAFHRINELRTRIRQILSDDVQPVVLAASGHADVDACRARRLRQERVGGVDGCALDAIRSCCVGQVRVLAHILGR